MGGHLAGDVASKMATEAVGAFFESTAREDATWPFHYDPTLSAEENRLVTGIKVANKSIYEASARSEAHRGMGTTVVGILVASSNGRVFIGHVGDSRCYRVRDGAIELLTQDHSLVNEYMRAMPELTEKQREELPRNVITRALGMTEGVMVDLSSDGIRPGDRFVLCSDGLSGMIADADILDVLTRYGDPDAACAELIRRANAHGGEDNITAVVIKIVDDADAGDVTEIRPMSAFHDIDTEVGPTPSLAPGAPTETGDKQGQ